ncbi:hypothetical protein PMIT1313_00155 [Prochlorococcus marinus str. MIT 1313]|nr:hypothetical protein PMIT1313_00155 [Prochlorococcus marinus str. MIT 1313]KZR74630.1 hypothetical protein PMIT1318_00373 [Prochlorococcus marinus str. MIT 1318]
MQTNYERSISLQITAHNLSLVFTYNILETSIPNAIIDAANRY